MSSLDSQNADPGLSIQKLKGVGPRIAEKLERLNIYYVEDLLFHLPIRYEDRTQVLPIGSLRSGQHAVIEGQIQLTEIRYGKRRMLLTHISDGTGRIILRFFHFSAAQQSGLAKGARIRCYGEVRRGQSGLEMIHPEYQKIEPQESQPVQEYLTPIYPTTEGLHQLSLRNLSEQALRYLRDQQLNLVEILPEKVLRDIALPSLQEALLYIHRPPPDADVDVLAEGQHPMQLRLAFEELMAHTLSLRKLRYLSQQHLAYSLDQNKGLGKAFLERLPFELTPAQRRVTSEIDHDLQQAVPMQRLVQGDVGSGKTVVAALSAIQAVESGFQAAIMAPTELLAEQHYQNFLKWLEPLNIEIAWLSGKQKNAARKQSLSAINEGTANIIIGTHALFQEGVTFKALALVIVDEQHRFGVHQRLALREKGAQGEHYPHQLIMTATPIPRTLAMTAYADLDCSVIDELPPGRKPIETVVVPDSRRDEVMQRVEAACQRGRQVYWVCTLIEESEVLQCEAAENTADMLTNAFPALRIGLVHGRMKPAQKEQVMASFKNNDIDLLVATTVIEVGVDVPNASLMVIENAERLGLAQQHQLRGRVGRGQQESICVLMYHAPLSQNAKQRLNVMRETNDGFVIAQKDLEIRGPGEVLGTRQTGVMQLRIADLQKHSSLLPKVTRWTDDMLNNHPDQSNALIQRWVGSATRFAQV